MALELKRNDLRPHFRVSLTANGDPVDLTDATSAFFLMKQGTNGTPKVDRGAMTFVDRATGTVEYAWVVGDTDTAGTFNVEVEVLWGTEPQTFPSKGYWTVTIEDDLG
jgi:hypothetical protein